MAITVNVANGTVTIVDGIDGQGNAVLGTENLLLQLALDRAAANTARVSLMQADLQAQNDKIKEINAVITRLLGSTADPALNGASLNVSFTAAEVATLGLLKDANGQSLSSYLAAAAPARMASGKSLSDLMTGVKSELNQATSQNQQAVIQYQSLINQRNQMTEWVANLITVLATAASQTAANLR
jgi:hypothetical protein